MGPRIGPSMVPAVKRGYSNINAQGLKVNDLEAAEASGLINGSTRIGPSMLPVWRGEGHINKNVEGLKVTGPRAAAASSYH